MLKSAKFRKLNNNFQCLNCGKEVPKSQTSCRNHCPYCLYSKHVDVFPGDRANSCMGNLKPVGYNQEKKGIVIYFKCQSCNEICKNIAALEDQVQPDNYDAILALGVYRKVPR